MEFGPETGGDTVSVPAEVIVNDVPTKGPWVVGLAGTGVVSLPTNVVICKGASAGDLRLIAAAPDLLAACQTALDYIPHPHDSENLVAAIKKVLGTAIKKAATRG